VLNEPESCRIEDLDPKRYGVITSSGWRRGLLLPDLEGVEDVMDQVRIAMQKAGIRPDEPCSYERFRSTAHLAMSAHPAHHTGHTTPRTGR
jgi:AMMECR1 domain-containing protein